MGRSTSGFDSKGRYRINCYSNVKLYFKNFCVSVSDHIRSSQEDVIWEVVSASWA